MREFDYEGLLLAKFQGEIFEQSVLTLNCSSKIFLRRFRHSNLLKRLDENESFMFSLDPKEALREIENEFGTTNYGKIKFSNETMFWLGYFLRYISYTRDVETPFLLKKFDYNQLIDLYYVYHTQDMEWCINDLLKLNNYTEDIFDRNKRLKAIIKEYMLSLNKTEQTK